MLRSSPMIDSSFSRAGLGEIHGVEKVIGFRPLRKEGGSPGIAGW
ncbi:hypothetical protein [Ammoniphilus sp. 3BR4]